MSKYDFELDLGENTSTGMILNRIKKGSTVLEFGCATGRMTRYMKEMLDCRVYIVEYDRGAFDQALQFAEDGVCDDIMNFSWAERFEGVAFDAVIFADVLEHLPRPEQVLKRVAAFLKEDGRVLVSVPNVTHNDIVLKMYGERFDYTSTGLLDDTHVHFWGLENIKHLGREADLWVRTVEGTTCAAGNTEQNVPLGNHRLLENILRQRQAGEIYQFVVMLDKAGEEEQVCTIGAPAITSHIYLDTGKGFNLDEQIPVSAVYTGKGAYVTHFEIKETEHLRQVRLDPVEFQGAILRSVSIRQGGEELPLDAPNGIRTDSDLYLPGDDPMVIAQVNLNGGPVCVDAEFMIPGGEYLNIMESLISAKQMELEDAECLYRQKIQDLHREIKDLHSSVADLNKQIAQRDFTIAMAQEQCRQLQIDVGAYISLVNEKEKYLISLEQELQKAQAFSLYRLWICCRKLRSFAGRGLRKIKRCIKKILGRTN